MLVGLNLFLVSFSAISDTCMAMGEWVENPHAETALSNILPCVDQRTTNQTLFKSKQVINDIVNMVNGFVGSVANSNPPPQASSSYYNQSGPLIPALCYPYDSQLQDRPCSAQELSMENASLVIACFHSIFAELNVLSRIAYTSELPFLISTGLAELYLHGIGKRALQQRGEADPQHVHRIGSSSKRKLRSRTLRPTASKSPKL